MFKIQLFSQNNTYNNSNLNFLGKGRVLKQTANTLASKPDSFQYSSAEKNKHKDAISKMVNSITDMVKNNKTTEEITEWIINKSGIAALSILALSGIRQSRIYEPYLEIITKRVGEGKTDQEIANEINKDAAFVFNVRKCFNIKQTTHKGRLYEPFRDIIVSMNGEGKTDTEIAEKIGKTPTFVNSARIYFGLTHTSWCYSFDEFEQNRETITRMVKEYKTNKEIACAINKSETFVVSAKRYLGLTNLRKKGDAYQPYKDQISQMCSEGKSEKEIAEKIGKTPTFVNKAKKHLGISTPRKKGKVYKPYEKQITQMVNEGMSNEEIAEAINKDTAFVNSAKMHFGLTRPKTQKDSIYEQYREIITQMVRNGMSNEEIANVLEKDITFVYNAKSFLGLTRKKGDVYKLYEKQITQMVRNGMSNEEIADAIDRDVTFVSRAKAYFKSTKK